MDLEELRALVAVAETGSLLSASEHLRVSRTTLRRRLDALESRAGATLVVRTAAGATLTPGGEAALDHARRILMESAAFLVAARTSGDEEAIGLVRIAAPIGVPRVAVLAALQTHLTMPGGRVDIRFAVDPLRHMEDVDVVFHFGARQATGAWVTRIVHPARERVLASPDYLARRGRPERPEDLVHHDLLSWSGPTTDPCAWPLVAGGVWPVEPRISMTDADALRELAVRGAGLLLAPDSEQYAPDIDDGRLVPVLEAYIGRDCPFRVVIPEAAARSPRLRRVVDVVRAVFREE